MDTLLINLSFLDYEREFCKVFSLPPLHKFSFKFPEKNANEQFFYFATLTTWLLQKLGISIDKPGQFDDPNVITANIMIELRNLSIHHDVTVSKLKQGYGEAVVSILTKLTQTILTKTELKLKKPIFKNEEEVEEANVDEEAEIIAETFEEVSDEEDEPMFISPSKTNKKDSDFEVDNKVDMKNNKVDLEEWKLELERVVPLLKIQINNENKDWRLRFDQFKGSCESTNTLFATVKPKIERIEHDIKNVLEKIKGRESYIDSHFQNEASQHKELQEKLSEIKRQYLETSSTVSEMTNELGSLSEELEKSKEKMDEIGNGMTDAKPLVNIKQAVTKLKNDIKNMDLRIRVIETSLVHGKLKSKRQMFGSEKSALSVFDFQKQLILN